MPSCQTCQAEVLDIDVKCPSCGANLTPTGAHRLIGETVLGQYRIVDVLGQGGMSVVYRGRHTLTDQDVALKVLPPELAAYSQVKSRFVEEAKALAQLDHPNIVHLYNFGQENGSFVLAMQFVQGATWERLIVESDGQAWPTATRIAIDVLRGLEFAHGRGVVHRDMKPSNVLVREDDGTATVMDFGIAKMTTSTRLTATGQTMGTVRYMSPEQVRGQDVDARSDIYSLGATLYEALVGDTPFDGNTHFEIMSKHLTEAAPTLASRGVAVPPVLEAAVLKSLSKKVEDRFATARDFRKELEEALKEAHDGFSETQRLSRETVAKARSGLVAAPVAPTPAGVGTRAPPSITLPGSRAAGAGLATEPPTPVAAAVSLADQLEPELAAPAARRTWPWLWLGLGALVLAAAAAVAWRLQRSPAAAPAVAAAPKGIPLPTLAWQPTLEADGVTVRVVTASRWRPAQIAATVARVRAAMPALFEARGVTPPTTHPPLTVAVIPKEALCAPGVIDSAAGTCGDIGTFYRLQEKTLLVVDTDDQELLDRQLAEGLGEVACLYTEVTPCFAAELKAAVGGHP
ncbi:MAG: protein kinase [Kofleriaceae bacterium]